MHSSVFETVISCNKQKGVETSTGALIIWCETDRGGVSVLCAVQEADGCTIRSEPSEEPVAVQDPGSRAQIIRGALCDWGHTGVETRRLISCHKPSIKRQSNFLRKPQRWEHILNTVYTHTHMYSLCVFVFTVRLGNVPYFLLVTDAPRQLRAHVLTQVHTHPDRCCIVMACPTLAACFPQTSHPVWWLRDGGDERRGRDRGRRGVGDSDRRGLQAWDSLSVRRLSKSYH